MSAARRPRASHPCVTDCVTDCVTEVKRSSALGCALALALLCACPADEAVQIAVEAPSRAGEPYRLRARFTLQDAFKLAGAPGAPTAFSGRAHLALRLPPGWRAQGSYTLAGRTYALLPAPLVSEGYEEERPTAHEAWSGFVSHLHTNLETSAVIEASATLLPPTEAAASPDSLRAPPPQPRTPENTDGGAASDRRAATTVALGVGLAPAYPNWRTLARPPRLIALPSPP